MVTGKNILEIIRQEDKIRIIKIDTKYKHNKKNFNDLISYF